MALTLEVTYEGPAGLRHDYDSQLKLGGLFAQVDTGGDLEPFAEVALLFVVDGAAPVRARGRLTVAAADSICIELPPEALPGLAAAVDQLCANAEGSTHRRSVRLLRGGAAERPARPAAYSTIPLDRRIAAMSVSEKVQLALHGERDARQLLMRERAGVVQASLVRNPRSSLDEITALARSSLLAPDAAEVIAQHATFGASSQVSLALVRNPRTPIPTAVALVAKLQPSDLRAIAKSFGVRTQIAQAARKRMLE